ncbi:unnamed protein product [Pichia kudriavzevii]
MRKLFSSLSSHGSSSSSTLRQPIEPSATNTVYGHNDKYHTTQCNKASKNAPLVASISIESPPIILYGPPSTSCGAFFSGTFKVDILKGTQLNKSDDENEAKLEPSVSLSRVSKMQLLRNYIVINDVSIYFLQIVRYGKPFQAQSNTLSDCSECSTKITELAKWDVLSKKTAFAKGSSHLCPFGYVLPGNLPPTSVLSNASSYIQYELVTIVKYMDPVTKTEKAINLAQPINVQRSILREQDRNSTRIFPPTDVTATAVIPNVAFPRSAFPVEIRMDHVSTPRRRWRMRKLSWRMEECTAVKINHCKNHKEKFNSVVESTKKQNKSAKISKNSGGAGHSVINTYFQKPKRQINNSNNSITPDNVLPDLHPSDDRNIQNIQNAQQRGQGNPNAQIISTQTHPENSLAPMASNWSVDSSRGQSNNQVVLPDRNNTPTPVTSNGQNDNESSTVPKEPELYIEEIKTIASGELKSGWKSDFSGNGRIELVVNISLMDLVSMGINHISRYSPIINSSEANNFNIDKSDCNCAIDIDDPKLGISVTHNLIIEIVIGEELMQPKTTVNVPQRGRSSATHVSANSTAAIVTGNISQTRMRPTSRTAQQAPSSVPDSESQSRRTALSAEDFPDDRVGPDPINGNKSDAYNNLQGVATGVARVLRMQFKVILSERSGLGVSFDDEVPPTYHSVGALSPPAYTESEICQSDELHPTSTNLVIPLDTLANLQI